MKSVPHKVAHATVDAVLALLSTISADANRMSLRGLEVFHGLTRDGGESGRGKAVYYTNGSVIEVASKLGATSEAVDAFKTMQAKLDAGVLAEEAARIARETKRAERAAAKAAAVQGETDETGAEFA
jgi:hypothetical protein